MAQYLIYCIRHARQDATEMLDCEDNFFVRGLEKNSLQMDQSPRSRKPLFKKNSKGSSELHHIRKFSFKHISKFAANIFFRTSISCFPRRSFFHVCLRFESLFQGLRIKTQWKEQDIRNGLSVLSTDS